MPGSKLNKGDIFDDSFFKALQDADKELKDLLKTFKNLAKEAKEISKGVQAAKTFSDLSHKAAKAGKSIKDLTAEEKRLERATRELAFQQSEAGKRLAEINHEKNKAAKANRDLAKSQDAAKKSTNTWGNALKSFQFKFNALGNAIAQFAQVALRRLKQAFVTTFNIVADFDQAMADVKAVTKASRTEMDLLTKSAQKLGGTTKFTATQVAQLQKEYAKLGFSTKEILDAQAATLDLAAATNTELPRAAEVVGITVRQFGLSASESKRVADVMAESFSSSALDMEKFAEAMKYVGPAAKASGISLEQATARLAQLADAGISGSQAGTALRQIMLALSKESGTFSEKIERAAAKGLDLAGATEEVKQRAATALLVLSDGVDTVDEYAESLRNAAGASQEMADVQLDTLQGKLTLVKSAWEGMILAMLNTEENLSGVKWALEGIVNLLNALALRAETGIKLSEALAIEKLVDETTEWAIQLDKSSQNIDTIVDGFKNFKENFKGIGKEFVETLFPKPEEVKIQLEDISEQLKKIKEEEIEGFQEEDQEYVQTHSDVWATIAETTEGVMSDLEKLVSEQTDFEIAQLDKHTKAHEAYIEAAIAAEEMLRDYKIDTANQSFAFISTLFDRQMEKIKQMEDAEIISAEKAEEEKRKIRRRAAVVDKAQALFNIALNTAMGVTNAAAKTVTIPLIPWIIGLGAAQAATVIATPVPQFEKGTDSAPGGLAVVGEKGRELLIGPDGKIALTPESATLMDIDKGTKIFPSDITNEILRYTTIANALEGDKDERVILAVMQKIDKSNERLYKAIKDKPVTSSILTPAGIRTLTFKGSAVMKKMDKYFK